MPLNRDFIGREYPASETFEVSRELIRRFALAAAKHREWPDKRNPVTPV